MKKILSTLALTSLVSSSAVLANDTAPHWNNIQATYLSASVDDADGFDPTGLGLSGSFLVNENVFIAASYSTIGDEISLYGENVDLDFSTASAGIGYRYALSSNTDAYVKASIESIEIEASANGFSEDEDETGFGVGIGIRSIVSPHIELSGELAYIDIDDESETTISLGAHYHINAQFAVGATYTVADDVDTLGLAVRYKF